MRCEKGQTAQNEMLDEFSCRRIAGEPHNLGQPRSDDLNLVWIDARRRNQVDQPLARVDIKFARFGQTFTHVFDPIAVVGIEREYAAFAEMDDLRRLVNRGDRQMRFGPAGGDDRFAIGSGGPGFQIVGSVTKLRDSAEQIGMFFLVAHSRHSEGAVLRQAAAREPPIAQPKLAHDCRTVSRQPGRPDLATIE